VAMVTVLVAVYGGGLKGQSDESYSSEPNDKLR
jgi:hypothetical protein